jgi:hypothetical protein
VHCCSKFWRKSCSKMLSPKWFRTERRRAAPRPRRPLPRRPRRTFSRRLIFSPRHMLPAARAVRARRADCRSVHGLASRSRRRRTMAASSSSSGRHGRARALFKVPLPPRRRAQSRPAAIAALSPSSTVHEYPEPANHLPPFPKCRCGIWSRH